MKKFLSLPPVSFVVETAELYLRVGAARAAAALSYFLILTLFPLLVCVNYFIGLFHLDLENLLQSLDQILPAEALAVIQDYLSYVAGSQSDALLLASLITILISASAGLRTLLAAMDELHGASDPRPFRRAALSVGLSALFLLTVYLSVVVIFTGEWFFWLLEEQLPRYMIEHIPLSALSGLWRWMRYLLLFCFVLLLVLIVYRAGAVLLVYRDVLPLCPGLWVAGLPDYPAGVALPVRQSAAAGGGGGPGAGGQAEGIKTAPENRRRLYTLLVRPGGLRLRGVDVQLLAVALGFDENVHGLLGGTDHGAVHLLVIRHNDNHPQGAALRLLPCFLDGSARGGECTGG